MSAPELSEDQVAAFRADWEKWPRAGRPPPVPDAAAPRRVRLRLWAMRQVDTVGSWLCGHHAGWAAVALWGALGMWP